MPNVKQRVWLAVMVFVVATYAFTAVLFPVQTALGLTREEFNLISVAPLAGTLVTLALRKRLRLGVRFVPGFGISPQMIRRTLLMLALGVGVILLCVQFYTWFRWPLRPAKVALTRFFGFEPPSAAIALLIVGLTVLIAMMCEEIGWRALLEPTVRQVTSVLGAAGVVALIWGLWQWPVLLSVIARWQQRPKLVEVGLFLAAYAVSVYAISLLMVVVHNRMRKGQWLAAVAFRWAYALGTILLFDEERARWQPMGTIAASCVIVAALGFAYYWRTLRRSTRKRANATPKK